MVISESITWDNSNVGYDESILIEKGTFEAPINATQLKLDDELRLDGEKEITIYVIVSEEDNKYNNSTMTDLINKGLNENDWPKQIIDSNTAASYSWEINYKFKEGETYYIYYIPYDTTKSFATFTSLGTATL